LEIVKKKDKNLYAKLHRRWLNINREATYVGVLARDGHEITKPKFFKVSPFSEGTAAAQDIFTRRFGYIDTAGKWTIAPKFIAANPFSHSVATAKLSSGLLPIDTMGQYTFFSLINKSGVELKKLPDLDMKPFSGTFCIGCRVLYSGGYNAIYDLVDSTGEVLFSGGLLGPIGKNYSHPKFLIGTSQRLDGCIMSTFGFPVSLELKPEESRHGHFKLVQSDTTIFPGAVKESALEYGALEREITRQEEADDLCKIDGALGQYWLVDRAGQKNSKKYSNIERLSPKCFRVHDENGYRGLADEYGAELVSPKYDEIRAFSEGLAAFQIKDRWGFVDVKGKEIVPAKYAEVGDFHDSVTFYRRKAID